MPERWWRLWLAARHVCEIPLLRRIPWRTARRYWRRGCRWVGQAVRSDRGAL